MHENVSRDEIESFVASSKSSRIFDWCLQNIRDFETENASWYWNQPLQTSGLQEIDINEAAATSFNFVCISWISASRSAFSLLIAWRGSLSIEHAFRCQTLEGSFSAVSKPNFASKYAFESSRRDLHNALLCTVFGIHSRKLGKKDLAKTTSKRNTVL